MNRIIKLFAAVAMALSLLGSYAPAALAAAPANDVISGATVVALGYSESIDTTEATTDADDAQLNTFCGALATDASVWYQLEGTDEGVIVDVSGSNYSAGVLRSGSILGQVFGGRRSAAAPAAPAKPKADFSNVQSDSSQVELVQDEIYVVAKGDSLSKIAKRFYGDANQWKRIFEANRDRIKDPELIQPGWELRIPKS